MATTIIEFGDMSGLWELGETLESAVDPVNDSVRSSVMCAKTLLSSRNEAVMEYNRQLIGTIHSSTIQSLIVWWLTDKN
ncbi:hypothetical protein JTE90_002290 [Oedothorax gibbosus]|uniref:Uncharacterized protein n=1 Tax=Oedothorax gibbosus TaxID=931172 RepID=A0AAV6U7K5_9ARAC|nr:hypothetical protein JTE90_002290 [Oedothorax gibbosus]